MPNGERLLVEKFAAIKDTLPKGRMSRWANARHLFDNGEPRQSAFQGVYEILIKAKRAKIKWREQSRQQRINERRAAETV